MREVDGTFRNRKALPFTMIGNSIIKNRKLSMGAKGLYMLIMTYTSYPGFNLTKAFLLTQVEEGEKAFDTMWNRLKKEGYLKVYFLRGDKGRWITEYALLDEPSSPEEPHTFYCNRSGEIMSTNLDREAKRKADVSSADSDGLSSNGDMMDQDNVEVIQEEGLEEKKSRKVMSRIANDICEDDSAVKVRDMLEIGVPEPMQEGHRMQEKHRTPKKGVTVKPDKKENSPYPYNGTYRDGSNGKGGNNNNTYSKTNNNAIIFNSIQFNSVQKTKNEMKRSDNLREEVKLEILEQYSLPYWYNQAEDRITLAIHLLTDWEEKMNRGFIADDSITAEGYRAAFEIFNNALINMCSTKTLLKLKGESVSYAKVFDKINLFLSKRGKYNQYSFMVFQDFCEYTIKRFLAAIASREISDYNKYMQSIIWESFQNYDINFYKAVVEEE